MLRKPRNNDSESDASMITGAITEYGRRSKSQVPASAAHSTVVRRKRETFVAVCDARGGLLMAYEVVPSVNMPGRNAQGARLDQWRLVARPELGAPARAEAC